MASLHSGPYSKILFPLPADSAPECSHVCARTLIITFSDASLYLQPFCSAQLIVSRNENTIETKWLGELIETFRESADFDLRNRLFEYF